MAYKDKEKGTKWRKAYYQKHKEDLKAQSRQYGKEHRKERSLARKIYYQIHIEQARARARKYYQNNKDKIQQQSKLSYEKHKEKYIIESRNRRRRLKLEVLTNYSGNKLPSCSKCGITDIDILCIDHIEGNGNKHRREIMTPAGNPFLLWLKRNNYPLGFQVLCYNCNMKKRMVQNEC